MANSASSRSGDNTAMERTPSCYKMPRNIRIYDSRGVEVAGVEQLPNGVWTGNRLYRALDVCFVAPTVRWWLAGRDSGREVMRDNEPVAQGYYDVMSQGGPLQIENTATPFFERTITPVTSPQVLKSSLVAPLRLRDGKCVITGRSPYAGRWTALQACHIVPLTHLELFNEHFSSLLLDDTFPEGQPLNSVQNGLILGCEFHAHFVKYDFSIDPDDGYRIVWFSSVIKSMAPHPEYVPGLRRADIPENQRVLDEVLRWHYTQAVLGNVRGAGVRWNDSWDEDLGGKFGRLDLSEKRWTDPERKGFLESELGVRLYDIAHRRNAPMYAV
ncbi:hypothetical protein BOTBODRAFT_28862 [Botryobasidium botryosum FD-172 SS1]|uniref:HNH nuclease domain-containing protein n=1 Tax=Botryobasidium botryosum (strain FD-172 SS1) TaxID=930990 RepID=A0A067MSB1_BOTB1|nr:hypothetical protein BOTBODRAFT_28862 [Botryobasidium botryosum FD-172 SS1]